MTAIDMVKPLVDFITSLANLPFLRLNLFFVSFWEVPGHLRFTMSRQLSFRVLNYVYGSKWSFLEGLAVFPGDLTSV